MPRKVLFLVPYPLFSAPSQRFRFEQYFKILDDNNILQETQSFLDTRYWKLFFTGGNYVDKALAVLFGFAKRFMILFRLREFDFVFIHRETAPIGPPLFEWVISNVFRKKVIYDFDDAIWLTDRSRESWAVQTLKWRRKVSSICRWSFKVSCGNKFLYSYASVYNANACLNPTTIDISSMHNPALHTKIPNNKIVIGWTGSHSTLKYLDQIENVLKRLEKEFSNIIIVVIADKKPILDLDRLVFVPWNQSTEIQDLMQLDIGIMPLPGDDWSKGKCGFKLLQYMSLEIPVVASPVGVNTSIVNKGINGFLASSQEEWEVSLRALILDPSLRKNMGKRGREKIVRDYSVLSNASNFLELFSS